MPEIKRYVDVIIPVYRPDQYFLRLLDGLSKQTIQIGRLILINTDKTLWTAEAAKALAILREQKNAVLTAELHHISREEFDHAATRRYGVMLSDAPVFVCMTDDAVPADEFLLEKLLDALSGEEPGGTSGSTAASDPGAEEAERKKKTTDPENTPTEASAAAAGVPIAMAYARQLAAADAAPEERFTRNFNYPAESGVKTIDDLPRLGIKTYFASNVCCAYRRALYDRAGGFPENAIFNEDMICASRVLRKDCGIAYAADARVIHSHSYTAGQQLKRNFDLGMSQAMHPEVFGGIRSEGEGFRLVKDTALYLIREGKPWRIARLFTQSAAKYLGYRLGKSYRKLPYCVCHLLCMNKTYLEQHRTELFDKGNMK